MTLCCVQYPTVFGDLDPFFVNMQKAFHLQSSCDQLLSALDKYIARIRGIYK